MEFRKSLTYSYPTSENARKHGFGMSGCYVVNVTLDGRTIAERAWPDLERAIAHYDRVDHPTDSIRCMADRLKAAAAV